MSIYITADIHGKYQPIRDFINIRKKPLTKDDTIVLLGDSGFLYFFNERDERLKEKINFYGVNIFTIRGNHEERPSIVAEKNPDKWHIESFFGNDVYVEDKYPNIKYALDIPSEYLIPTAQKGDLKVLVLPGAYSVDKYYRIANGWSWFENEQCNEKERTCGSRLAAEHEWDMVWSHTAPAAFEPTDLFLPHVDQTTVDRTTERWLGGIEYDLDYKLWVFGHFHSPRIYPERQGKQILMLFNDCYFDVYKYFCANYPIDKCLIKTNENTKITNLNLIFK